MQNNLKFRCINPLHSFFAKWSNYQVGNIYDGYEAWWDAESGEICMRIFDEQGSWKAFRDNDWKNYFEQIN